LERVGARGSENGAAQVEGAAGRLAGEAIVQGRIEQPAPTLAHSHHLEAVLLAPAHHRADHRIETRAVSPARQHRDLHLQQPPAQSTSLRVHQSWCDLFSNSSTCRLVSRSTQECSFLRVTIITGPRNRSFSVYTSRALRRPPGRSSHWRASISPWCARPPISAASPSAR